MDNNPNCGACCAARGVKYCPYTQGTESCLQITTNQTSTKERLDITWRELDKQDDEIEALKVQVAGLRQAIVELLGRVEELEAVQRVKNTPMYGIPISKIDWTGGKQ